MKKLIQKLVNKILSKLFPYKETDSRPDYTFSNEGWVNGLSRTQNLEKYVTGKM